MTSEPSTITIDDLDAPRLPQRVRDMLDRLAFLAQTPPPLRPDALMEAASEASGLSDFGDPWFTEGLEVLCTALREEAGLSSFGVVSQRGLLIRLLTGRLVVQDLLRRHPEIRDVPIRRPIVIAGLPRSGTTFLHNLLAADPALCYVSEAEAIDPVAADQEGDGPAEDPMAELTELALPHLKRMHEIGTGGAQEDIVLLAFAFSSSFFETQAWIPGYRDWYLSTDQRPAYEYLRTLLQILQWRRGGERWVLKAPQHVEQLPALLAAFPDAHVVVTHRDPVAVTASVGTMMAYFLRLNLTRVDAARIGAYWADRVATMAGRCLADRDVLPADRSTDVRLQEVRRDTDTVIRRVYATAGQPLTPAALAAMDRVRTAEHPHRHGRVRYDLSRLGLDPGELRNRTAAYRERFGIEAETVETSGTD